jgi:hypothetical protein
MRHRFHTSTRLCCLCSEPHNVSCNGCPRSSAPFGSRARRNGVRRNGKRVAGLRDLSTRPCRSRRGTSKERIMEIERLRRQRWTGARIAHQLGLSAATLGRVPRRLGLNRAGDLEPLLPPNRYEHLAAGDLLHLDIKRLVHPGAFAPSDRQPRGRRQGHRGRVHACCHRSPLAARLCCHVSGPDRAQFHTLPGHRRPLVRRAWHRHPPRAN